MSNMMNFAAEQPPAGLGVSNLYNPERFDTTFEQRTKMKRVQIGVTDKGFPIFEEQPEVYIHEIDWVEFAQHGESGRASTWCRIKDIANPAPPLHKADTKAILANLRWQAVEPRYRAYKAGLEMTSEGTPLAAWGHLDARRREILQQMGLKTIEAVAGVSHSVIARMNFPNAHQVVEMAKAYLVVAEKQAGAAVLKATQDELNATRDTMSDMQKQLAELQQQLLAQKNSTSITPVENEMPVARPEPPQRRPNRAERQPISAADL
jgi:hypothetical protein